MFSLGIPKVIFLSLLLISPSCAMGGHYTFISGSDLYDALSQDSMMLKGYFLGVVDVLKDIEGEACVAIPLAADADRLMIERYLSYWHNKQIPDDAVDAIKLVILQSYPCSE